MANTGSEDQHGEVEDVPPSTDPEDSLLARVNVFLGDAGAPEEVEDEDVSSKWAPFEKQMRQVEQRMRVSFEEEMRQARAEGAAHATRELRAELHTVGKESANRMERSRREMDEHRARIADLSQDLADAKAKLDRQSTERSAARKMVLDAVLHELLD